MTGSSTAFRATRSLACTTGRGSRSENSQIRTGPMMAGGAYFDIAVNGRGAHGARPEAGIDPVIIASHITTALQTYRLPQCPAARYGGPQRHPDPRRRRLQCDPGARLYPRHRARLRPEDLGADRENMARIASGVASGFGAAPNSISGPCFRRSSTTRPRPNSSPRPPPSWSGTTTSTATATS